MDQLVRPTDDRVIAGVCAGLARYFNIDPTIVRLVFVLAVFLGGVSPLVYVLLWIVIPEGTPAARQSAQPPMLTQDPTNEWNYDPYTGQPIERRDQNR
jgi:phage shock protein C